MSNIIDKIQVSGVTYDLPSGGGGNATVELTQAEYDALVSAGTVSANTYYIITDAQAGDLTQYWTSAQTQSAITQATSGKVDSSSVASSVTSASTDSEIPTAKAVYDATQSGGGGGTTYTAGRGIDITNNTISVSLPISAGTGTNSIVFGNATTAQTNGTNAFGGGKTGSVHYVVSFGQNSFSYGEGTQAYKNNSQSFGNETESRNISEHSIGQFNVSNSATTTFGNSGNTLFSVGNGTSNSARHNAFEIRQNGDIYLSLNGQDVKLQDQLGGSSITVDTALDSGSTNPVENRVIYNKIDEVEQVTARALNGLSEADEVAARALIDLNDKFGGLKLQKLTQAQYDALSGSTDSNTLYVIVN